MPPKKKDQGLKQTNLSSFFGAKTTSTTTPLKPSFSSKENDYSKGSANVPYTTTINSTTNVQKVSQTNNIQQPITNAPLPSSGTGINSNEQSSRIGGKESNGTTIIDNDIDTFSTKLSCLISLSDSNPPVVKTPILPQSPKDIIESPVDKKSSTNNASIDLGRQTTPTISQYDSDSEDELLRMPTKPTPEIFEEISTSKAPISASQSSSPFPSNSLHSGKKQDSKLSLLDRMATPKGTQPLPRTTEALNSRSLSQFSRASSRPTLPPLNSTVSFDRTNQDSRIQNQSYSIEPRSTPQSQNGSDQQKYSLGKTSSSQKRSGDFATYPNLSSKKRILPSTIAGHQPFSTTPLSRSNSSDSRIASNSLGYSTASQPTQLYSSPKQSRSDESVAPAKGLTKDGFVLSDEQEYVLQQVLTYRRNVFFTGSAGTGKSVLLKELIIQLRNKFDTSSRKSMYETHGEAVAVTASTGIAACNIGGCTLHSFAGVGLGAEGLPVLQAKIRRNPMTVRRWQDTKVLIIDEVSMVEAGFMEKLEALARIVRKNDSPWGGIQIVLTGDFFQLPPVNKSGNVKFCFEGEFWSKTIHETIQLKQVFRQKDPTFADMLNEMRLGKMSESTIQKFRSLTRDLPTKDGLRPTELFPLRNQVDEANSQMLNNLPGKSVVYHARDSGPQKEKMEQNCLAPTVLHLKLNSQVMLLRNQGGGIGGLVNGSIGILIGFVTTPADNDVQMGAGGERKGSLNKPGEELPKVRFTLEGGETRDMVVGREEWKIELPNGEIQGSRVQIPLGLAWSLSIHKSQGQTLPKVRVDLGRVFEKGQAYVALSRATSLEGLQVINFDPRKVMVHPRVTEFYANLRVYKK